MHYAMCSRGARAAGLGLLMVLVAGCGDAAAPTAPAKKASARRRGSMPGPPPFADEGENFRISFPDPGPGETKEVTTPGGEKIIVRKPVQPQILDQQIKTPFGTKTVRIFKVDLPDGTIYSVAVTQIGRLLGMGADADAILDSGVDGAAKQWDIKHRQPIELGPYPGRLVRFEAHPGQSTEKGIGCFRAFLIGDRLYQVVAVGPESKVDPQELDEFTDSFAILKGVPVIAKRASAAAPKQVSTAAVAPSPSPAPTPAPAPAPPPARTAPATVVGPGPDPAKPAEIPLTIAFSPEKLADLPRAQLGGDQGSFREIAPAGGLLVGARAGHIDAFGGNKVGAIWPVYQVGGEYRIGSRAGKEIEPSVTVLARPGYAVGAINTRAGLLLDGFQLVFMKVKDGRLDPNDAYQSDWLGDSKGGGEETVSGDGRLVVGLHGRAGKGEVNALGIVVAE